jgi:PAS domain S-box-containing protein
VLIVVAAVVALAALGASTDAFDRLQPFLHGSGAGDDIFGAALLVVVGLALLGLLQARHTRMESAERSDVEERLRAEDRRWRQLLEDLPVVAYEAILNDDGDVVDHWMGHGIEGLLGVPVDGWRTEDDMWERMIHPDDHDAVVAEWDTMRHGARFDMQYRMIRTDGAVVWVHDRAVRNHRDGLVVIQGAFADVTASKEAEAALQLAEERFRTLVEQLPAVVFSEDPVTGDQTYISPQIEAIYGFSAEEWMADRTLWRTRLHPDDREWVVAEDEADTGDTWSVDYRSITKDGRTIWLHNEARLLRDRDGTPITWQGLVTDITERKLAEERVRDAEERFRTLVEQLPVAVYTDAVDEQSTAVYISPQYEALTGYSPEQRLRERDLWVRMLHPDDRERVLAESAATNETGAPFDTEYRIVAADGRVVWVHDHAVLVRDAEGVPRWHGVLQDVTEQHLAADAIARRDAILEATGFAAERFLRAGSWQEDLDDVLHRLAIAGNATRCAVFRNHELADGRLGVSLVAAWPPDVPTPAAERARHAFAWETEGFGRWVRELGAGRPIHGSVGSFPASERALLEAEPMPIRSLAAVPVFVEDEWWGYISFDHIDEGREWLEADVEALAITARTIAAAIERQRATERFDATQARYRMLIEQIPAVTYIEDAATGEEVYSSPQTQALLGYAPEDWGSRDAWLEAVHPDDLERVLAADRLSETGGTPFDAEYRLRTASGSYVWVREHAAPIPQPDGARFWQGVRFDVTAEKQAEEQLRAAEERYRLLVEQTPAVTYVDEYDRATGRWPGRYVSPQVESVFGYTAEEWLEDADLWARMIHPDDLAMTAAADDRHHATGEPLDIECRIRRRDGEVRWIRDQAVIVAGDDGDPRFSQGLLTDITDRKAAEERLRDAEERYRAIVEHVPAVIYLDRFGPELETVYISPQLEDVLGVTPERWTREPGLWLELIDPDDRAAVERSYRRALDAREAWRGEYRVRTPDGRTVWLHDETTFLRDADGTPSFVQGVLFDITERKLAEQALRESEQREREAAERLRALDEMKNTFLAAVSHELRSPLTTILGLALTLERAPDIGGPERDDLLARLSANARKLDRLLKDLLDIDRLNRGIVEPQYRVTDVAALARRTVEHLDATGDRTVIVRTEPVVIAVDPPKVERILENLVMNAVRHTDPDRTIWVCVGPCEDGVEIVVEDDGTGVPPELRTAIFEPFRQGPTASPHAPGTGIGLSLVARFAELHGGRAWVGERPGGGAAFHVRLPGTGAAEVSAPVDARVADVG